MQLTTGKWDYKKNNYFIIVYVVLISTQMRKSTYC